MGLLNSKKPKAKQARILLLGLDSAGKSTLLYKLKLDKDIVTIPTVGFNVEMIELAKGVLLTVWDIGGQEKMRATWGLLSGWLKNEPLNEAEPMSLLQPQTMDGFARPFRASPRDLLTDSREENCFPF